MQRAPRWLLWRSIPRPEGGKPRKVPYYTDGARRSGALDTAEDLGRLVTLDEAIEAMQRGTWTGPGFALGPDGTGNHWQGIDLDGTTTRPELAALAEEMPGYREESPSGTGVHALGYGPAFPALGSNASGIEAYSAGRFFTVTGASLGGDIEELAPFVAPTLAPWHGAARSRPRPAPCRWTTAPSRSCAAH